MLTSNQENKKVFQETIPEHFDTFLKTGYLQMLVKQLTFQK